MNSVNLVGRLTKEPELRYTAGGNAVCSFTLAVDRQFVNGKGEREADFIPIVVWNKPAESCAKYLHKGSQAAVTGRIQVQSYDDKDGKRRYRTDIIAQNVQFLSSSKAAPSLTEGLGEEIIFDEGEMPF